MTSQRLSRKRYFVAYWMPAIFWTALVLIASNDAFSAENTGQILEVILPPLFGPIEPSSFEMIHFLVRKTAHITEYGILGLIYFRAWRGESVMAWRFQCARQALAMCMVVAAMDEFHQSFVPSRTSSPKDVALDVLGAGLFLAAYSMCFRDKGQPDHGETMV